MEVNDVKKEENTSKEVDQTLDYNTGKTQGITSLVLGIVSVLSCFTGIGALIGVITGIIGLVYANKAKRNGYKEGIQTGGFVSSLVGLIVSAIEVILIIVLFGSIVSLFAQIPTYGMYTWY